MIKIDMNMPKKCGDCIFLGDYTNGPFSRNPHHCCELIWHLEEEDYKVDTKSRDENCPLIEV